MKYLIFFLLPLQLFAQPNNTITSYRVQNRTNVGTYGHVGEVTADLLYANTENQIWTLCTGCIVNDSNVIQGYHRKWKFLNNPNVVDTIFRIPGQAKIYYRINGRISFIIDSIGTGGGGGTVITFPYTIHQYYNGYGNFVGLNTDSITQGSANLFNQTHTGDATGATVLTVVGIRNVIIPSLTTGNLRYSGGSWIFDNTTYITGITANNGLIASTLTNVQLGGTLIQNTGIAAAHYYFNIDSASKQSYTAANDSMVTKMYLSRDTFTVQVSKGGTLTATLRIKSDTIVAGVATNTVLITKDTMRIRPYLGRLFIDTLTTGTRSDSFVTYNPATKQIRKINIDVFNLTYTGLVPKADTLDPNKFLSEDGVWRTPSGTGTGITSFDIANVSGATQFSIGNADKIRFQGIGGTTVTFPGSNTVRISTSLTLSSYTNDVGFITSSTFIIANAGNVTQFNVTSGDKFQLDATGMAAGTFTSGSKKWTINVPTTLSSYTNDPGFITLSSISATAPISYSLSTGIITHNASGITPGTYNSLTIDVYGHATSGSSIAYLTTETDPLSVHIQTGFFSPQTGSFDISGQGIAGTFYATTQFQMSDGFGGIGIIHAANPLTGTRVLNFPNMTGVIPMDVNGQFADLNGLITLTTDNISEGSTNKYYTDARARAAISMVNGLHYSNSTGIGKLGGTLTEATIIDGSGSGTGVYFGLAVDGQIGLYSNQAGVIIQGSDFAGTHHASVTIGSGIDISSSGVITIHSFQEAANGADNILGRDYTGQLKTLYIGNGLRWNPSDGATIEFDPNYTNSHIQVSGNVSAGQLNLSTTSTPTPSSGNVIIWFDGTNLKATKNIGGVITTGIIF